jgi:hypothetical protein
MMNRKWLVPLRVLFEDQALLRLEAIVSSWLSYQTQLATTC